MSNLTDDALIAELKSRFDRTKQALFDLKMVTEKLEVVNRKLEESEKVKSNFLSNIKNEINNPLTSILGLSQQLARHRTMDPELITSLAEMIFEEAFILDFQLRNIFAAAELEAGDAVPEISLVDVSALIRDAVDSFQHLVDKKQITIHHIHGGGPDEEGLLFKTDAEKLLLVVSNLISNAIEFNKEGGRIDISAVLMENNLTITISDTGVGIASNMAARIFDRFHQLETGFTKSHKGHGLGLSICKAIIDMMEGNIAVACTEGEGCTFSLTIPQVEVDVEADAFAVDGNEFLFDDDGAEAF